jgi:hypothetical protein
MKKSELRKIIREEISKLKEIGNFHDPRMSSGKFDHLTPKKEKNTKNQINFPIDNLEDLNKFFIKDYTRVVGEAPEVDLKGILRGDVDEMYEMDYAQEIVDLMHAGELTDEKTASRLLDDLSGEYFG